MGVKEQCTKSEWVNQKIEEVKEHMETNVLTYVCILMYKEAHTY